MTRDEIVKEARSYLGTPFINQGRQKGVGVDCGGVVKGICDFFNVYCEDIFGYNSLDVGPEVKEIMDRVFIPIEKDQFKPGDFLLFRILGSTQHIAIATDRGMLHGYSPNGQVIEHRINRKWQYKLVAAYQIPGVND